MNAWTPETWRSKPILQAPHYSDHKRKEAVLRELGQYPPLVLASEIRNLKAALVPVADGRSYLLQGGDCAESFSEFHANTIRDLYQVLLEMAAVLAQSGLPVVMVGRIAGQFAKPRSAATEQVDGIELTTYRGDIINAAAADMAARQPDPGRMLKAYHQSAATLNLLRALAESEFVSPAALGHRHALYLDALGLNDPDGPVSDGPMPWLHAPKLFTSHEALLLPYEQALTRQDSASGRWYDCSAHMLWIGDRTRDPGGAHVEFCRGIDNPIGLKCGPSMTPDDLCRVLDVLDPQREPGRMTLIVRMGAEAVLAKLPPLIEAIRREGRRVIWSCDPMHGNTVKASSGYKTRDVKTIGSELGRFFTVHRSMGTVAGGLHLELTGKNVTECTGGIQAIDEDSLASRYHTHCDPRLNGLQAAEMAHRAADLIRNVI